LAATITIVLAILIIEDMLTEIVAITDYPATKEALPTTIRAEEEPAIGIIEGTERGITREIGNTVRAQAIPLQASVGVPAEMTEEERRATAGVLIRTIVAIAGTGQVQERIIEVARGT
jgi:hypothetical protein